MPADVYRGSTLGSALSASLDELISSQDIPASMREQIMRLYDKAMCEQILALPALKDGLQVQGKADQLHGRIEEGKLETYRFFNGNWTFDLKQARLKGHGFNSAPGSGYANRDGRVIQNVHVVAVDCKQAELEQAPIEEAPLEATTSGAADEGNEAATIDEADAMLPSESAPGRAWVALEVNLVACTLRLQVSATDFDDIADDVTVDPLTTPLMTRPFPQDGFFGSLDRNALACEVES